jgi:hypothetical protein
MFAALNTCLLCYMGGKTSHTDTKKPLKSAQTIHTDTKTPLIAI